MGQWAHGRATTLSTLHLIHTLTRHLKGSGVPRDFHHYLYLKNPPRLAALSTDEACILLTDPPEADVTFQNILDECLANFYPTGAFSVRLFPVHGSTTLHAS